mgnify:CR=1 FL=1
MEEHQETKNIVRYKAGDNMVELSPDTVRKFLVSGEGKITDQEIMMFLKLCEYQQLNPFLREVYLIKYGNKPAAMVTGKETFLKRAYRHPKYRGHKTGISDNGQIAWGEVYVEGYVVPIRCEVDFKEYVGKKSDGTINRMWASKPNTMLKKVALVQALREAFPETFGGMYSQEEINTVDIPLPTEEISMDETEEEIEYISEKQLSTIVDIINEKNVNEAKFLDYLEIESLEKIPTDKYDDAMAALRVAKGEREPGSDDA